MTKINETLESLEKSWSRDHILIKIKNGEDIDFIVNEFIYHNKDHIIELRNYIDQNDKAILNQLEDLSNCEAKLINKINNLSILNNQKRNDSNKLEKITLSNSISSNKFGLFMIKWSNKFVFIILLTITAIALTKQAYA